LNPSAANVAFILNGSNELLVATRDREPAKGTLDLPGGFADIGETAEQGVAREVKEETGLTVTSLRYLFSRPNTYLYSGFEVKTLDSFFLCEVANAEHTCPHDDAAALQWVPLHGLRPELFGLDSIREGLIQFLREKPWQ
jgi:ADP-ribose pyrophosphatase YjhB (NUDIX family)